LKSDESMMWWLLLLIVGSIHAYRLPLVRLRTTALHSGGGNKSSSSLDNVGLFAAAERKVVVDSPTNLLSGIKSTGSLLSAGSSSLSAEAELLRLEAEQEQLVLDRERVLREKRVLEDIDNLILKTLDIQSTEPSAYDALISANKKLIRKELFFRLVELSNVAADPEEKKRFIILSDSLLAAVNALDPALHATVTADIERELAGELDRLKTGQKSVQTENVKVTNYHSE
jgi:hypothetical protein